VDAWLLTVDEAPIGPSERLDVAQRRRGKAWRLRFDLPVPCRHYFLRVATLWRDSDGSKTSQDATWTFHLRRPPMDGIRCESLP
jgi:hypothetical protein